MKTKWCDHRLQDLFNAYNAKYWDGRLRGWSIAERFGEDSRWDANTTLKRFHIWTENHETDADVEESVLRAMVTVVTTGADAFSADPEYWEEVDRLLGLGASFTVSESDFDDESAPLAWALRRFPNIRAALDRSAAQRIAVATGAS